MQGEKPIIQLVGVDKIYGSKPKEVKALESINLDIIKGEIFGIIGLSGAGKSTLVRCMNLLERPTAGKVLFENEDLMELNQTSLSKVRQRMGMIFQQFNLLMQRTALDNVCFPQEIAGISKKQARIRAKELLALVGLSDKEKAYPAQLSGGQKQRVAIARALATNPSVLLCDEATSALDPTTTRSILELLKEINRKLHITIVIITHEMAVIEEICQRVAIIDQSKIAEIGDVIDVFREPKSEIAKQLVFSNISKKSEIKKGNTFRIIFDGKSSFEPVISNLVLECKTPVNILYADTRNMDGIAIGQMIIQVPDGDIITSRVLGYLNSHHIKFEEVSDYDR